MGAMLNVQLDRIDGMVTAMQMERNTILDGTKSLGNLGLKPSPLNSPDADCATHVLYMLPSAKTADEFSKLFPSVVAGKTGRHNYVEWDQVLMGAGAAHPAMNPYNMPQNAECRRTYSKDMCARSLDILNRTVMVPTHPLHTKEDIENTIHNIGVAARVVLAGLPIEEADLRDAAPIDPQKFDVKVKADVSPRYETAKRKVEKKRR